MSTKQDAERRFAQIEGERDYYRKQYEAVRRERDIHAANLSAIRIALDVLHAAKCDNAADIAAANLERVIENSGDSSSLHRLKAQWQAEALENVADSIRQNNDSKNTGSVHGFAGMLEGHAGDLRRQAGGAT